MRSILIWMSPEPGHVLPTIKIARDLTAAGHKVTYFVPAAHMKELEELGFNTTELFEKSCRSITNSLFQPSGSVTEYYSAISKECYGTTGKELFRRELLRGGKLINANLLIIDGVFDAMLDLRMHDVLPSDCSLARLYIHLPYRPVGITRGLLHIIAMRAKYEYKSTTLALGTSSAGS